MKKLLLLIPVAILVSVFLYMSGYRFTALSAVEAHSFLEKGAVLVEKVENNQGEVYIYQVKDYYLTIVPAKKGLFWIASSSITTQDINDKNDEVRTIGWSSSNGGENAGTVMVVEVKDNKVEYIEAGPASERIRINVKTGEPVVFGWNKAYFSHEIKPIAFSENGEELYMYGYNPLTPGFTDMKELRWHEMQVGSIIEKTKEYKSFPESSGGYD